MAKFFTLASRKYAFPNWFASEACRDSAPHANKSRSDRLGLEPSTQNPFVSNSSKIDTTRTDVEGRNKGNYEGQNSAWGTKFSWKPTPHVSFHTSDAEWGLLDTSPYGKFVLKEKPGQRPFLLDTLLFTITHAPIAGFEKTAAWVVEKLAPGVAAAASSTIVASSQLLQNNKRQPQHHNNTSTSTTTTDIRCC